MASHEPSQAIPIWMGTVAQGQLNIEQSWRYITQPTWRMVIRSDKSAPTPLRIPPKVPHVSATVHPNGTGIYPLSTDVTIPRIQILHGHYSIHGYPEGRASSRSFPYNTLWTLARWHTSTSTTDDTTSDPHHLNFCRIRGYSWAMGNWPLATYHDVCRSINIMWRVDPGSERRLRRFCPVLYGRLVRMDT